MASDSFQYRPLGENQIRFISFQPMEGEAECEGQAEPPPDSALLDCYLYRGSRDMQDLVALSYAWGAKENVDQISLNGYEMVIQANLKAALTAIRKQRPTIFLWIDALCINQGDDKEKSIEVGFMRDIYRNAKQVIAWLGPPDDSSDDLMMKMTMAGTILRSPFKKQKIPVVIRSAWPTMSAIQKGGYMLSREARQQDWCKGTWAHYFVHFTINDDAEADLPKSALQAFFKRPFWLRAWIVQEFSLPNDLYFQIGESRLNLEDFLKVCALLGMRNAALWGCPDYQPFERKSEVGFYDRLLAQASTLIRIRDRLQTSKPMKIENLLIEAFARNNTMETLEVTDARDRVYGLLGLATDCAIRPDYSKSCVEVYTEVAEQMLKGGITDFLQYTTFPKKIPNLPSWVPDWSSTNRRMLREVDLQGVYNAKDSPTYDVDSLEFATGSDGIRQLRIAGTVLGKIAHILPPDDPQRDEKDELLKSFVRFTRNIEEACLQGCIQCNEVQHRPMKEMIAKVICANQVSSNGVVVHFSPSQYRVCYEACTEEMSNQKSDLNTMAWSFWDDIIYTITNRRPFVTSNGWLGIASLHVQPKDLVCRLDGCKSPYILRKTDTGCYNFLGECFIGANDEEAQEKKQASLAKVNFCIE